MDAIDTLSELFAQRGCNDTEYVKKPTEPGPAYPVMHEVDQERNRTQRDKGNNETPGSV